MKQPKINLKPNMEQIQSLCQYLPVLQSVTSL